MLRSAMPLVAFVAAACSSAPPVVNETPAPPTRVLVGNPSEQYITSFPNAPGSAGVSEIIPASADAVYAGLDEAYAAAGIEVAAANSRERTMGNADFRASRRLGGSPLTDFVKCGEELSLTGSMATSKPVRLSVLSTVTPSGEASRLTTRVQAAVSTGERGGAILCQSTGALEAAISRAVKLALLKS